MKTIFANACKLAWTVLLTLPAFIMTTKNLMQRALRRNAKCHYEDQQHCAQRSYENLPAQNFCYAVANLGEKNLTNGFFGVKRINGY
ncbi:MAG: hypothetical protein EOO06_19505 [Chitinophagaceae bacterium]|nr:MAG: hypothetical protein EOO06_19505 [Chitinophagaceae bacterium]